MTKQMNPNPNQRHGRLGQVKLKADGTIDEIAEAKRLKQNEASRRARAKRKAEAEALEKTFTDMYIKPENVCDKWGITQKDRDRYIRCCSSVYHHELSYVKMRTGLTLKQISILQDETKLYPVPPVDKRKADADYKRRKQIGDVYLENPI